MKQMNIAIFPGSFDPVTKGHESIVLRALPMFDKIIVAIGENTAKKTCFSLQQRKDWLEKVFKQYDNVEIDSFDCLTVDYCKKVGASYILRGVRNMVDYQYEANIARINNELSHDIETVFLMTKPEEEIVSSSFIREMLAFGKNVDKYLPQEVRILKGLLNK